MTTATPPFGQFFHFFLFSITHDQSCAPNLRFVSSDVPEILGGPEISKVGHVTTATPPFGQFFIFFCLVSLTINVHAKFEVCIFSRSRDITGVANMKSRLRDHGHAPVWPIFHFFCLVSLTINLHAKFEVCNFSRSRNIRGPKI